MRPANIDALRKQSTSSKVILFVPDSGTPGADANPPTSKKSTGSNSNSSAKAFVQKYDTLLVALAVVVFLALFGIIYVQRFYLSTSIAADEVALPGTGSNY